MGEFKTRIKMAIAGSLVAAGVMSGVGLGAGQAEAKVDPGHYKFQVMSFGAIPGPISNARVIGNRIFFDYNGIGPWNLTHYHLTQTRNGGIASTAGDPLAHWYFRYELRKTPYGYKGKYYNMGIVMGDVVLRKVR